MSNNHASHVAIIMDGNGRWANQRLLPRHSGHLAGVKAVEKAINAAANNSIKYLTLFAFSSENVNRSESELTFLKKIFYKNISERLEELHKNEIKIKFIGDLNYFGTRLNAKMQEATTLTRYNNKLTLTIALNYGGRWDIVQACNQIINEAKDVVITEELFSKYLSTSDLPDLDLLIRTSGEQRVSNFMLWQLAYSEFYFLDKYWPEFTEEDFKAALDFFVGRQRRFGTANDLIANGL